MPMKEHPILFSGPMVRAILDGRKTQTRRIVKPPKSLLTWHAGNMVAAHDDMGKEGFWNCWQGIRPDDDPKNMHWQYGDEWVSPNYQPGDRLYVRETHWRYGHWVKNGFTKTGRQAWRFSTLKHATPVLLVEPPKPPDRTTIGYHKRPSIFMPRWASRITLEVKAVRVKRVQDISEHSILAEGIPLIGNVGLANTALAGMVGKWMELWDSINAKRGFGWDTNPWVWVVEFERLKNAEEG